MPSSAVQPVGRSHRAMTHASAAGGTCDTCQHKAILVADVPRMKCEEHGVATVSVSWAKPGSGFTAMFEALVIDWLKEASISAVSRLMGLSWNAIDRIMQRAVKRGLARRTEISPTVSVLMRRPSRNVMIMQQSYQTRMQVQCYTWVVTAKRPCSKHMVRKSGRGAARSDRECLHGYVAKPLSMPH